MTAPTRTMRPWLPIIVLSFSLIACTSKMTPNPTDTTSSTTPGAHFTQDGLLKADHKVQAFASLNFENLKDEMAQGRGEYLASLETLLGVPEDRHDAFAALVREHYPVLFASNRTTPNELVSALNQELSADPILSKALAGN